MKLTYMLCLGDTKHQFIQFSGFEVRNNVLKVPFCFIIIFSWRKLWLLMWKQNPFLVGRGTFPLLMKNLFTESVRRKKQTNRYTEKQTVCFKWSYTIRKIFVGNTLVQTFLSKNKTMFEKHNHIICHLKNWTGSHINMKGTVQL